MLELIVEKEKMSRDKPRVSIGLPVFNGENYLTDALDSILAQTYSDFELIISDNAATDRTREICEAYATQDSRIRYYRNQKNIGAAKNFNRVFELALGEYFKWSAHDDVIAPDFLMKCVDVLDQNPDVVLCIAKMNVIGQDGHVLTNYDVKLIDDMKLGSMDSPKTWDRFGDFIMLRHPCFEIFGLIRTKALKMTALIASHIGSDRNLLVELALLGRFYQLPEPLFLPREHPERSTRALPLHSRAAWFDPTKTGRFVFIHWRIFFEYFKSTMRVSLNWYERARCFMHMGNWLRFYGKYLVRDVLVAAKIMPVPKY
ncbi:MAG: glycosyltransferase family 2 protein [Anaerolineae bacterium]